MRSLILGIAVALVLPAVPAAAQPAASGRAPATVAAPASHKAATTPAARRLPGLAVRRLAGGLDHPGDVKPIGPGRFLFTQRERRTLSLWDHGQVRRVQFPSRQVWSSGETGLMSLAVDPGFGRNRRFFDRQGGLGAGGGHDLRVIAWRLNAAATRATRIRVLISGFPATSGRHGGCRLLIARNGALV